MADGLIHIPARKKQPVEEQTVVKLTPEAYNALVDIYNESTLSLKQIASLLIVSNYGLVTENFSKCSLRRQPSAHKSWSLERK